MFDTSTNVKTRIDDRVSTRGNAGDSRQYLTFDLAGETYAVDVRQAATVIENVAITKIPRMPEYVLGVIDFRGQAIPLVDLRTVLGLAVPQEGAVATEHYQAEEGTVVMILEIAREEQVFVLGAAVDQVREVIVLNDSDLDEAPDLGTGRNLAFIDGIARGDGERLFLVLNAEHILDQDVLDDPVIMEASGLHTL